MSNPHSSKVFELIERKGDKATKKTLKDKRSQLELAEIQLYSASGFDQIWLTNRALKLRNEIQDLEKPFIEEELDAFYRDRVRARQFLFEWEKEILEYGSDKETKWFIQYVWERI